MNNEHYRWERLPNETSKAFHAFQIFLNLGANRSLAEACRVYKKQQSNGKIKSNKTEVFSTHFHAWSVTYNWHDRAMEYDNYIVTEKAKSRVKLETERELELQDVQWYKGAMLQKIATAAVKAKADQVNDNYETNDPTILEMSITEIVQVSNAADQTMARSLNIAHKQELEKLVIKNTQTIPADGTFNEKEKVTITDASIIEAVLEYTKRDKEADKDKEAGAEESETI